MAKQTIYTVGGTVQAGGGVYIKRKADDELLELCRRGEIALVLSSRQVGKSSLMVRTAQQLETDNIRSGIVDLSAIGTQVTQDEWYLGILNELNDTLKFKVDIFNWWMDHDQLGATQRLTNFFRDVLLNEVSESIVLFFDEIDSTMSIPFSDDFFAALRAVYNARSTTPEFRRLSFVLIGVATPSDLITDSKRTPFNLGRRVELTDFTLEEARPLAEGLGENPEQVLAWVFNWTGGHPYLTQRLCSQLSKRGGEIPEQVVEATVERLFIGEQGLQDNNIQFVKEMLAERAPDVRKVLKVYKDIRAGKKVIDDERAIPKAHLKISGVVRRQDGHLVPRNRIYESIFDLEWIKENIPPSTARNVVIGASLIVAIALMITAFLAYQEFTRTDEERTARFESNFNATNDPQARLKNLAGIFELKDKSFASRARNLFNGLPQDKKLELFKLSSRSVQENQVMVTVGIYESLDNSSEGNEILRAMAEAMKIPKPDLASEITFWIEGREALENEEYYDAKSNLSNAIHWNAQNPALYYDRAQLFITMGEETYPDALDDLNQMIKLDPNRTAAARLLIDKNPDFSLYWSQNSGQYPALAEAIPPVSGIVDDKGVEMVLIPEGNFIMGSTPGNYPNSQPDEQPAHTVHLDAYYIDRYEVTNKLYTACVDARRCPLPRNSSSDTRASYYGNSQYGNYPVIFVDWNMAKTYCEWRGARLPTEAEWEKAARGTDGRLYPWGQNIDCTYANYLGSQNGGCVGDTTGVGSYESGQSPYGVYDMAGNVWEWVADWYDENYYATLGKNSDNPPGPTSGQVRVLRGGGWPNDDNAVRSTFRLEVDPSYTDRDFGFRCVRSQ